MRYRCENVVMALISGYHMVTGAAPNGEIAFGRSGRRVHAFGRAARKDDHGMSIASEAYAVPGTAVERMTRWGRGRLSAARIMRKGLQ